jgi:hypothetical protein
MIHYSKAGTIDYTTLSECMILKQPVLNSKTSKHNITFLLIRLNDNKFGFIESDFTSIYYGISEITSNCIKIVEKSPKELKRFDFKKTGKVFEFNDLIWFDLNHFFNAKELYNTIIK